MRKSADRLQWICQPQGWHGTVHVDVFRRSSFALLALFIYDFSVLLYPFISIVIFRKTTS